MENNNNITATVKSGKDANDNVFAILLIVFEDTGETIQIKMNAKQRKRFMKLAEKPHALMRLFYSDVFTVMCTLSAHFLCFN